MRKICKKICIKVLYYCYQAVFNLGINGVKTYYEPLTEKTVAYASSQNIKRCVKNLFIEKMEIDYQQKAFTKLLKKEQELEKEQEQGGVSTLIDPKHEENIFGAWNINDTDTKYRKASITSCISFSPMIPINPLLSSLTSSTQIGVHNGDYNSKIYLSDGKKTYKSAEELKEKYPDKSTEELEEMFKHFKPSSFFKEHQKATGLYSLDVEINLNKFMRYCIEENKDLFDDKIINELKEEGWKLESYRGRTYIYAPVQSREKAYKILIECLFEWDFETHQSLNGRKKELLRVSFTNNDLISWQQATRAEVYFDENNNKKAKLVLNDNLEDVYSFNTTLLKNHYEKDIQTSIIAHKDAMKKIIEIGYNCIENN